MSSSSMLTAMLSPEAVTDLQTVLAAWQDATTRLEQTHDALREEVRRLTDELEVKNRELARKNRLADLGQMASHVAHEVRNNLVPVTLYLSLLRRRIGGDRESCHVLDRIESGFTALDATVNDLLHFTSDRDPQRERLELRPLVEEILASLAPQLAAQAIATRIAIPSRLAARVDRPMLRRALLNLVLNAIDVMPGGGALTVEAAADRDSVQLAVADTGCGVPDENLARVFEPFFTTKSGGTGLGLAIVYRIAEVHGGRVLAGNRPGGGAVFTLVFPQDGTEKSV